MNVQFTLELDIEKDDSMEDVLSETLRNVAGMIEEGFTSGYQPYWNIKESE